MRRLNRGGSEAALLTLCLPLLIAGCTPAPNTRPAFSAEQQLERGVKAYFDGQYALAETDLLAVTRRVPSDGTAWFRLGNLYMRQQKLDQAAQAYQQALVHQSSLNKAWHNLGVVQLKLAQRHFQQLHNRAPAGSLLRARAAYFGQELDRLLAGSPLAADATKITPFTPKSSATSASENPPIGNGESAHD